MSWNVEGWSGQGLDMKEAITEGLAADVAFYCETWATSSTSIDINGYHCINKPRLYQNKNICSCRGGMSFIIKNSVLDRYKIVFEDLYMDEVLYIKLIDKVTSFAISLFGVYLPPDTSPYGQHADLVFEYILNKLYECYDDNLILVLGDINARFGEKLDFIPEVDEVPDRTVIDHTINDHGRAFLNFLL